MLRPLSSDQYSQFHIIFFSAKIFCKQFFFSLSAIFVLASESCKWQKFCQMWLVNMLTSNYTANIGRLIHVICDKMLSLHIHETEYGENTLICISISVSMRKHIATFINRISTTNYHWPDNCMQCDDYRNVPRKMQCMLIILNGAYHRI